MCVCVFIHTQAIKLKIVNLAYIAFDNLVCFNIIVYGDWLTNKINLIPNF